MPPIDRRLSLLRRLALLCAAMVLAVTSLSAFIRLSNAGLGCADWPACYGQSLRQLQQGVAPSAKEQVSTAAARLAHRVVAVVALVLVLLMVMVCFGSRPVLRTEGALALTLLALALYLAVLGRWSSGARIPAVTLGNLLGGFAMLALCARLALTGLAGARARLPVWATLAMALVLAQVALGGLVSSSFSGLSCDARLDCGVLARLGDVDWRLLDPWREPVLGTPPSVNPQGDLAHGLHRLLALPLAALLAALGIVAWRRGRRRTAAWLLVLLAAQAGVGLAMVQFDLPLALALAHNLLAAALLAVLILLF